MISNNHLDRFIKYDPYPLVGDPRQGSKTGFLRMTEFVYGAEWKGLRPREEGPDGLIVAWATERGFPTYREEDLDLPYGLLTNGLPRGVYLSKRGDRWDPSELDKLFIVFDTPQDDDLAVEFMLTWVEGS